MCQRLCPQPLPVPGHLRPQAGLSTRLHLRVSPGSLWSLLRAQVSDNEGQGVPVGPRPSCWAAMQGTRVGRDSRVAVAVSPHAVSPTGSPSRVPGGGGDTPPAVPAAAMSPRASTPTATRQRESVTARWVPVPVPTCALCPQGVVTAPNRVTPPGEPLPAGGQRLLPAVRLLRHRVPVPPLRCHQRAVSLQGRCHWPPLRPL